MREINLPVIVLLYTSRQIHKGLKFVYDISQNLSPKTYNHDIYMQYLNFHI